MADSSSDTQVAPSTTGRGRRPAGPLRSAILHAASEILNDEGMSAVTFERVARAAGASKTTLYKWWPSPAALIADAHFGNVEPELAFPDTGDLERDLTTQLRSFVELLQRPAIARTVTRLIGAAQENPDIGAAWREHYSEPRRRLAVERFELARRLGQLGDDVDPEVLVDQLWGACYHRLLIADRSLSADFADALVRNLCRGILA